MVDGLVAGFAFLGGALIVLAALMLGWIEVYVSRFGHQPSFVWKFVRGNVSLIQLYTGITGRKSLVCYWYWFFFAGVFLTAVAVLIEAFRPNR